MSKFLDQSIELESLTRQLIDLHDQSSNVDKSELIKELDIILSKIRDIFNESN
jgi:hypothetical protein